MINHSRRSYSPSLPVARRTRPVVVTCGPEPHTLKLYDQAIVGVGAKGRLAELILTQEARGLFRRPAVDALNLSRMILKHARKRVARKPMLLFRDAVKAAGHEILGHYAAPKQFQAVCAQLNATTNSLLG